MADAAQIEMVKDLLPGDAEWDDTKIGTYLDSGLTIYGALAQFWESRTAKTANLMDINESGSSRALSQLHSNAKAQAEYWRDKASIEKDEANSTSRITIHRITRI